MIYPAKLRTWNKSGNRIFDGSEGARAERECCFISLISWANVAFMPTKWKNVVIASKSGHHRHPVSFLENIDNVARDTATVQLSKAVYKRE